MATIIIIGVVIIGITLGLGFWSYLLGKRNQSNFVGTIIPIAYFVVRTVLAVTTQNTTHGLVSSLVGSLLFSLAYYGLFAWGKYRTNK
ncbi:hypothetical protein ALX04_012755 [Lactiplantibacillus plantarum subsp. plantarum]|uniref:hypothetical protein n=1 Tax=Lactiplantibacillus TaxID=2767842 RepID=UPI0006A6CC18|nr:MULTISPECIES: hypothetical protein [Lactiplantibacillus]ARN99754.1 hypothetical protein BIZ31_01590 [Lactiplantibacillus plantarum]ARO02698.1 hypothetical protein BIZ32_01590 [Lactiplantibacillus plantarum]ASI64499.1 hypothetical protein ALX04_012755 [Lactiplantibacillus plantarum subsp. plantarum]KAB1954857.1 hypothetical protein F8276_07520 [Lactiplantibacillus plantarum]KAE9509495.1 hypothetical protein FET70_02969 [Lactiplantibacillus plantarum]